MKPKIRVQFDFFEEEIERLDELKEMTQASTRAETVREALQVYAWFVKSMEPESTVRITDKENNLVTIFKGFVFQCIQRKRTQK